MKKLVSLLLTMTLIISCCAFASADDVITIQIWHPRGAGANGEMIASSVEEFNRTIGAEKGIVVEEAFQGGYGDVLTNSMNAITAGNPPEIAVVENSGGTPVLAKEGVLANLDELIERDGWDLDNVFSGLLFYCRDDEGHLIAMPYIRSTPVMYYNKTMTDALGIEIPMDAALSIDEFTDLAKKLTEKNDDGSVKVYGFSLQSNMWYTQNFFYQLGSNMFSADGNSCPALEDGAMLTVLKAWRSWIDEGWCQPYVTTGEEAYLEEQFSLGNIAIILDSTGKMGNIFGAVEELGNNFEIGISFLPTFGEPSAPTGGGNMAIIKEGNSQEEIDAAWEFMKFLLTPEQDALNHVRTGYVPSTKAAADMDIVKELWEKEPFKKVGFNQLAYAQDAPASDYGGEWGAAFTSVLSSLIQEQSITPEEAIEQLKVEAENIFE